MRRLTMLLLALSICHQAFAQDHPNEHTVTTAPIPNGRFQIIESTLAVKMTFKLDRQQGLVSLLVHDEDGNLTWDLVPVDGWKGNPEKTLRYELFTSGMVVKNTFLLDTLTGSTWIYAEGHSSDGSVTRLFQKM